MSGERINNQLRNNGISGGVFSFSLNDILNVGDNNNNVNGSANTNGNTNANLPRIPGLPENVQFSSLGDTIAGAIQGATGRQGEGPDLASLIGNLVQSFNTVVSDPHHRHRRATRQTLDALTPLHLSEIPEEARSSNCPICYEAYVEYDPDAIRSASTAGTDSNANAQSTKQSHNDAILEETLVGPWKGFDVSDPSISFPAIETATYQHAYSMTIEPELGLDIDQHNNNNNTTSSSAEELPENDIHYAVKLPQCNHIFGRPCIVEWLESNVSCPLCRREILPEQTEDTGTHRDNAAANASSAAPQDDRGRTFVYDRAITETYVPVDWTAPLSAGYLLSDPPLTLPVPGVGMSTGHRTGRDP